jgi:hypothetical protein
MKAWNVEPDTIRSCAHAVGLRIYGEWNGSDQIKRDGRALRFRLRLDTEQRQPDGTLPYQRISRVLIRPRRVSAVCWHGHRDFMLAVFAVNPDARIKTALADYRGADDFERKYRATFGEGNHWNLSYGQACVCGEGF